MNIPVLPADKANHLIMGLLIFIVVAFAFSPLVGLAASIAAGLLKEWWDSKGHGCVEFWDFLATAADRKAADEATQTPTET